MISRVITSFEINTSLGHGNMVRQTESSDL